MTSLGSPICMFNICKVLKQSKLAKTYNFIFGQNLSSGKIFVASEKFRHFCPTFFCPIRYAKFSYLNLQLPAFTADRSLQKITNLMVRDLTKSHFLESCGTEMLLWRCYTTEEASRFRNKVAKIILAEINVEISNTFMGYTISFKHMFLTCFKVISQNCEKGFTICFVIHDDS